MANPLRVSKAFSDKNRIKILEMLSESDMKVGDVAEALNVEENLASHHLRVLASLGFLKNNKKGREVFYKINKARFVSLIRDLMRHDVFKEILSESLKG